MKENAQIMAQATQTVQTKPLLQSIYQEAQQEYQHLEEVFRLMGWGDLPDALKIEIKEDVAAMVDELEGRFSTCDPFVMKRRQSVTYWIDMYRSGVCSMQTAVEALKMKR
jgi:hypothetical protein